MIKTQKTFSWEAANGITEDQATAFYESLGMELGRSLPTAELRNGLMSGNSLLVNTALQTLYTNMKSDIKPTPDELTIRVAAAGLQMSDLALVQKMIARLEGGATKEEIYQMAGIPQHKVDALLTVFFDNSLFTVRRNINMTLAKGMVESGLYDSLEDIALRCGYSSAASFNICYKNWHDEAPELAKKAESPQLFLFE